MTNEAKVTIMEMEEENCHTMVYNSRASPPLLHPHSSEVKCSNHFSNIVKSIPPFSSMFRCLKSPADQALVRKACLTQKRVLEGIFQATKRF